MMYVIRLNESDRRTAVGHNTISPSVLLIICENVCRRHVYSNKSVTSVQEVASVTLKADSHITCRAHAVPLPCRAVKGLECVSHLIYKVRPCLIHTCHAAPMPCSDYAVLLKAAAQHGRREKACGLPARVRLPTTTRSSTKIVIRSIPILTTIHTRL